MWNCVIMLLTLNYVSAQFNGEFWWLNDKLKEVKGFEASSAKIEDDTGLENDETDGIVFDENHVSNNFDPASQNNRTAKRINATNDVTFQDNSKMIWPNDSDESFNSNKLNYSHNSNTLGTKVNTKDDDVFEFKFADEDLFSWKDIIIPKENKTKPQNSNKDNDTKNKSVDYKVHFNVQDEETSLTENICTYMKKIYCNRNGGFIYVKSLTHRVALRNTNLVCCILPQPERNSDSPSYENSKRSKRSLSKDEVNYGLRQRGNLMLRKMNIATSDELKTKESTSTSKVITQRVVSPSDDYVDPYWNIKSSKYESTQGNPYTQLPDDIFDDVDDDDENYTDELPKPGLVGLYSDIGPRPTSWTFMNQNTRPQYSVDIDSVEDDNVFGYQLSTINPRLDRISSTPRPYRKRKPIKLTVSTSDEFSYNAESHTIRYQSIPDFQVLQGYKLLNLYRNRSKIYYQTGKAPPSTQTFFDRDTSEETSFTKSVSSGSSQEDYDLNELGQQVYENCGKGENSLKFHRGKSSESSEVTTRTHPWLCLIVLSSKPQTIICYATLIHPKAAITVGDCIYGRSKDEISLIAGVRDLSNTRSNIQRRSLSSILHPHHQAGQLANNLALMHWKRPLSLGEYVQPACLGEPHVGDECRFVGWGGYDQAIKMQSRWQRGAILTPQQCTDRITQTRQDLPSDAFCAAVESKYSVTGIGGPLICEISGRQALVGVAVWRGRDIIMLSVRDWTLNVAALLNL